MKRLTCEFDKGIWCLKECCTFDRESTVDPDDCLSCAEVCENADGDCSQCQIQKALKKLAEYENLEEQGLIQRWIPVSEKLPENEEVVEITYVRKNYLIGIPMYLTARAFYTDGTMTTEASSYGWSDIGDNWDYDEETDSWFIPEGWWEDVSFTEMFGMVDQKVIAWRPLSEPYQPKEESYE